MYLSVDQVRNSSSRILIEDGFFVAEAIAVNGAILASVSFDQVVAVRVTDEGVRLGFLKNKKFEEDAVVEIFNSEFVSWLESESMSTRNLAPLRHFSIFLGEEVIDVVSACGPTIQLP